MGFVDRDGDDINNKKACEISGYDYLGSLMLLCKTDGKFNALPFTESELDNVFTYLVTGEIVQKREDKIYDEFCEKYGINPVLPKFPVKPKFFARRGVPYVIIARYNFDEASDEEIISIGTNLFHYSSLLLNVFKKVDGVNLSPLINSETSEVIGVLCGSAISYGNEITEEINYARPVDYVWELLEKEFKENK